MDKIIGFIGLGIMGKPMAVNLIKAGYSLVIFTTNPQTLTFFERMGSKCVESAKEVAQNSDVIITMLPDSPQIEAVALGENGLLAGLKAGQLYIDMSTIDMETAIKISEIFTEKGTATLDAPVSGGEKAALNGHLSIMSGGRKSDFERAMPIFNVLGEKIRYMGKIGSGQVTKSCNQIATALATQGVIEALALAKKAGLSQVAVREALSGGFANSKALEIVGERIIKQNFEPGFKISLYRKDLRIALQLASVLKTDVPGAALIASEMDRLIAQGKGDADFSLLISAIE